MVDAEKLALLTEEEREWGGSKECGASYELALRLAEARAELFKFRPDCLCKYAIKNWDGVIHDVRCEFAKSHATWVRKERLDRAEQRTAELERQVAGLTSEIESWKHHEKS